MIPFIDLKTQYQALKPQTYERIERVLEHGQYILGPEVRELEARLAAGIPTAVHYPVPLNEQPAYAHLFCPECTPVARRMAHEVMSLPMHRDLCEVDQVRIALALSSETE